MYIEYLHMLGMDNRCLVHELLEVIVQIFKDEVEFSVTVQYLYQPSHKQDTGIVTMISP